MASRSYAHLNPCQYCGRFLPYSDPYGDTHMQRDHPEEYELERQRHRRQEVQPRRSGLGEVG